MNMAKRVMRTEGAAPRIECELDDNERAQHRSQREQNGSEVRSVELERLAFVLLAKHTYP